MAINFGAVPYAVNAGRSDHFLMDKVGDVVEHHLKKKQWENRLALATQVQIYKEEERHERQKQMVDYRNNSRYTHNRMEARARRRERLQEGQDAGKIKVDTHRQMARIDVAKHRAMGSFDAQNVSDIAQNKVIGHAKGQVAAQQILAAAGLAPSQAPSTRSSNIRRPTNPPPQQGSQPPQAPPQRGNQPNPAQQQPATTSKRGSTSVPQPTPAQQQPQPASAGSPAQTPRGSKRGSTSVTMPPPAPSPAQAQSVKANPHASGNGAATPQAPLPVAQVNTGRTNPHASGNGVAAPKTPRKQAANPLANRYTAARPVRQVPVPASVNVRSATHLNAIPLVDNKIPTAYEHTRAGRDYNEIPHEHEDGPAAVARFQKANPGWRPTSVSEINSRRDLRKATKAGNAPSSEQQWNDMLSRPKTK